VIEEIALVLAEIENISSIIKVTKHTKPASKKGKRIDLFLYRNKSLKLEIIKKVNSTPSKIAKPPVSGIG